MPVHLANFTFFRGIPPPESEAFARCLSQLLYIALPPSQEFPSAGAFALPALSLGLKPPAQRSGRLPSPPRTHPAATPFSAALRPSGYCCRRLRHHHHLFPRQIGCFFREPTLVRPSKKCNLRSCKHLSLSPSPLMVPFDTPPHRGRRGRLASGMSCEGDRQGPLPRPAYQAVRYHQLTPEVVAAAAGPLGWEGEAGDHG